jgi:hypothetical protein
VIASSGDTGLGASDAQPAKLGWRRPIALLVVVVLAVATLYELALALDVVSIGELPGEDAPGAGLIATASVLAPVAGIVVLLASASRAAEIGPVLLPLLPLAAGCLVVAAYYAYDPYYAPTHRRYSDAGTWPAWWIYLVLAAAVVSAVVARLRPRPGAVGAAAVLFACLVTFFLNGTGH